MEFGHGPNASSQNTVCIDADFGVVAVNGSAGSIVGLSTVTGPGRCHVSVVESWKTSVERCG